MRVEKNETNGRIKVVTGDGALVAICGSQIAANMVVAIPQALTALLDWLFLTKEGYHHTDAHSMVDDLIDRSINCLKLAMGNILEELSGPEPEPAPETAKYSDLYEPSLEELISLSGIIGVPLEKIRVMGPDGVKRVPRALGSYLSNKGKVQ